MAEGTRYHAGDSIAKRLTFTLAAGEEATRITLLLTRTQSQSVRPTIGRARCIILEADRTGSQPSNSAISAAPPAGAPRTRFDADLRGVVPASICGGTYCPVFCVFDYAGGRPPTGFEIDADQRFAIEVADDGTAIDAGPAVVALT